MCGIVGITGSQDASIEVHQGLLILQHRGQDSAGIISHDQESSKFHTHKDLGQVSQVFSGGQLQKLSGNVAIGHTRYSTIGDIKECDLQPMMVSYPYAIALAHNGNVSNCEELKSQLTRNQHFFTSDNDLEVILHLLTQNLMRAEGNTFFDKLALATKSLIEKAEGGFSVVGTIGGEGFVAFRDRFGIRPLVYGVKRNPDRSLSYCFSSETSVLNFLNYQVIGEVAPGELILVRPDGELLKKDLLKSGSLPCMFEWIYFAGAESSIADRSVYDTRLMLGRQLGKKVLEENFQESIDVVVPVPDTSRASAIALSEELGLPYREVLIKNRYVQRSFIQNGQDRRKMTVNLKFSVIREQVEGKNILLVDDSIVRGTTSKKIVNLLRDHGAKSVYLASTCPPIVSPCFYGIDFPTTGELVAHGKTRAEIEKALNVEKVFYNEIADVHEALEKREFCRSCLSSQYPYPVKVHQGSTKDVYAVGEEYLFRFSDRYSVFDWGEMPDLLEGKGRALAAFTKTLYQRLGEAGIPHHLSTSVAGEDELLVKPFRVHREPGPAPREENIFIPLEVIFRLGVPKGSSLLKRHPGKFQEYERFEKPMIEFTTKLERFDRPLTHEEARELSNLSPKEWENLIHTTERIALGLRGIFAEVGIDLWDGKVEFAAGKGTDRDIILVDSIGPDELRLTKDGVQLSKEIIRQYYKATDWYERLETAKEKYGESFKDFISPPERLRTEFKASVEEMYRLLPDLVARSASAELRLQKLLPRLSVRSV